MQRGDSEPLCSAVLELNETAEQWPAGSFTPGCPAAVTYGSFVRLPAVMPPGGWGKLSTMQRYTYMNDAVAAEVHAQTSPLSKL